MRTIICLVVIISFFAGVFGQTNWTRPEISERYQTRELWHVYINRTHEYRGDGIHAADQAKGLNSIYTVFDAPYRVRTYRLQRYEDGIEYDLSNVNYTCVKYALNGFMPHRWAWLREANHTYNYTENGSHIDVWSFHYGYGVIELAVNRSHPNIPLWERTNSTRESSRIYFENWNTTVDPNHFRIPRECGGAVMSKRVFNIGGSHNVSSSCRARADIIAVASSWATANVPYNQAASHDGYREDCSGFVCACWAEAKPGVATQSFHTIGHQITKAELTEGDALLYAAEHVVLFGGWADAAKTQYTAYEETKPGEGTVKRVTPYPYWYSTADFVPFRANAAC